MTELLLKPEHPDPRTTRRFVLLFAGTAFLLLGMVAILNFLVDPAGVYSHYRGDGARISRYASALVQSRHGLVKTGNERLVKYAMLKFPGPGDCIVLGSSRAAQFSTYREIQPVFRGCRRLYNLWVSAVTLEDIYLFVEEGLARQAGSVTYYLAVDPWWLTPGLNQKYAILRPESAAFFGHFPGAAATPGSVRNLINLDYTSASWQAFRDQGFTLQAYPVIPQETPDLRQGQDRDLYLPDGSLLYRRDYIRSHTPPIIASETFASHIRPQSHDYSQILRQLIRRLRQDNRVVILLPPYHPQTRDDRRLRTYLEGIEQDLRILAAEWNLPVTGGYDPLTIGCEAREFFDYIHPRSSCLAKIQQ